MVGAVLAGGASRRMGGAPKAAMTLGGRTLLEWTVRAVVAAGLEPVIVAKPGMALPPADARLVVEPDEPRHPLTGLRVAGDCVALACDTPFVPAALLAALAERTERTFVRAGGRLHPLPGRWTGPLAAGGALLDLPAAVLEWPDADALFNVNTPQDLAAAERRLRLRGGVGEGH